MLGNITYDLVHSNSWTHLNFSAGNIPEKQIHVFNRLLSSKKDAGKLLTLRCLRPARFCRYTLILFYTYTIQLAITAVEVLPGYISIT